MQIISKFCSLLEFLQHIPYRFTSWWFPDLGKDNLNQCLIVMLRYLNSKVLGQMLFWNGVVAFTGSWLMFRISCFQSLSIIPTLPSCALFFHVVWAQPEWLWTAPFQHSNVWIIYPLKAGLSTQNISCISQKSSLVHDPGSHGVCWKLEWFAACPELVLLNICSRGWFCKIEPSVPNQKCFFTLFHGAATSCGVSQISGWSLHLDKTNDTEIETWCIKHHSPAWVTLLSRNLGRHKVLSTGWCWAVCGSIWFSAWGVDSKGLMGADRQKNFQQLG